MGIFAFLAMTLLFRKLGQKRLGLRGSSNASWKGFEVLEIKALKDETPSIRSIVLTRANGRNFPQFRSGQFLSIRIRDDDKVIRSYSFSSPPNDLSQVQISVKRLANGVGSTWLHDLKLGDRIAALPPSGQFILEDDTRPLVFIAGGVGITPILSMLAEIFSRPSPKARPIYLFYGARTFSELAFHQQLSSWQNINSIFHYHPILSDDPKEGFAKGYVTFDFLKSKLKGLDNVYYLCGPDVMTDKLINELLRAKVDEAQIRFEKFVSPTQIDQTEIQDRTAQIKVGDQILRYSGRENILDFLESQEIEWPFSCRAGVCGSCKCKVKGEVLQLTDAGLTRHENLEGYKLLCVSYPAGDLELDQNG